MSCSLAALLRAPERAGELEEGDWDRLVPQARQVSLLGTLYTAVGGRVPTAVARHLAAGWVVHRKQRHALDYELRQVAAALDEAGERMLLLKGAAYMVAGLPPAEGRLISDIDLLVRPERLPAVEAALGRHGWNAGDIDPYNERYYRQWMHEIPPLGHATRHSTLDVHHTILPPTAGASIDASALWRAAEEVAPGIWVLAPVDMVLHSATHLFHEGEFQHGLRDLVDLDRLLRHFTADSGEDFYRALAARAREMDLQRPLYYALRYTRDLLGTPVPGRLAAELLPGRPGWLRRRWMDFLFHRAFTPDCSGSRLPGTGPALFCLYVRSHYLRMPLRLLLPHLVRKAWMDAFPRPRTEAD